MTQVTGTVTNVKTTSGAIGPEKKAANFHTITLDTDKGSVSVQKTTLATTAFTLDVGTKVLVTYETTTNGKYTNNKIVQGGLVVLSDDTPVVIKASSGAGPDNTAVTSKTVVNNQRYDNNGARNGMITGKAVELAVARKALTLEGLKKAADDVKALTDYVETGKAITAPGISMTVTALDSKEPETSSTEEDGLFDL